MKRFSLLAVVALTAVTGSALAQATLAPVVKTAISIVTDLKGTMRDPDSFVVENISTYSTKKIALAFYISFRSRNGFGGMTRGCAMAGEYKGKMRLDVPEGEFATDICAQSTGKAALTDITKEVQQAMKQ